jgi:hypothetical protein
MASEKRRESSQTERRTLDGPWEWAFDRMMAKKRAAEGRPPVKPKRPAAPRAKRVQP